MRIKDLDSIVMMLKNRINKLTESEEGRLQVLVDDLVQEFQSPGQLDNKTAFGELLISRNITLRILCKLSEWCNTSDNKPRKKPAREISMILFGEIVPKLDDRPITILYDKIEFDI